MEQKKPPGSPLTGTSVNGTPYQRREIERWENTGWIFLHWTEGPLMVAVMENANGEVVYIDGNGWAWRGAKFNKADPVPLEQYPPWGLDEWIAT